ncbi:hypothetical protein R1flu_024118 [Riccia fluitans]|uniref:Uncharacterized protein n=1 Tax=Riccia fluitans TaxID=41844 RepID=A0ABD1XTZ8_9MARC
MKPGLLFESPSYEACLKDLLVNPVAGCAIVVELENTECISGIAGTYKTLSIFTSPSGSWKMTSPLPFTESPESRYQEGSPSSRASTSSAASKSSLARSVLELAGSTGGDHTGDMARSVDCLSVQCSITFFVSFL